MPAFRTRLLQLFDSQFNSGSAKQLLPNQAPEYFGLCVTGPAGCAAAVQLVKRQSDMHHHISQVVLSDSSLAG
jgi:hypothetical protein